MFGILWSKIDAGLLPYLEVRINSIHRGCWHAYLGEVAGDEKAWQVLLQRFFRHFDQEVLLKDMESSQTLHLVDGGCSAAVVLLHTCKCVSSPPTSFCDEKWSIFSSKKCCFWVSKSPQYFWVFLEAVLEGHFIRNSKGF